MESCAEKMIITDCTLCDLSLTGLTKSSLCAKRGVKANQGEQFQNDVYLFKHFDWSLKENNLVGQTFIHVTCINPALTGTESLTSYTVVHHRAMLMEVLLMMKMGKKRIFRDDL